MSVATVKGHGWWRYRYWVAIVLTFCYSIQYLDRVKTSVLAPLIMKDIDLSHAQYGLGMSLMLAFYGPMQAVVGWVCDRFGARRVLLFSIVSWSLCTWWMAYMQTPQEWYIRQIIFGILCATEFVPSSRILARWFAKRQRAQAQAALSYAWILTPAWAPVFATALATAFGDWRPVFIVVAALGVLPLLAIWGWVTDRPEDHKGMSEMELHEIYEEEIEQGVYSHEELEKRSISKEKIAAQRDIPLRDILLYPGFIQLTVAYIVIQALYWAAVSWSPTYLKETFGFSIMAMGWWAIVYFAAGVLGSFTGSRLSDTVFGGRRRPIISISYICTFPFLLLLAIYKQGVNPVALLLTLSAAGFFANMAWGPYYAWPAEIFSPEVHAKALGIINAVGYFVGAAGAPLVMSRLIVKTATGVSYTWSWVFIAALAVIGFLLAVTVKEHKKETPGIA
ncbi:MAG: MFS transporter [Syntrophothermus sp.]|uniref:MFS transporter n=1 Tax=Syntrophothermus sp. TaxID=2736299 RepID=UPI00257FA517|nr:MFS transporter [Syntrophothermus sp.]NSW84142.1 MFS transporter [Syntrophothermus sp.]